MKTVDPNSPGGRLRAVRLARKMTQADLGAALDRSRSHITKVEVGGAAGDEGGRGFWEKAAQEFRVPIDYFLGTPDDLDIAHRKEIEDRILLEVTNVAANKIFEEPRNLDVVEMPGVGKVAHNSQIFHLLSIWENIPDNKRGLALAILESLQDKSPESN